MVLRYYTTDERIAVIEFPLVYIFTFGSPGDESLNGHPLYKHGLEFYRVHEIEDSSWITELEKQNSVHPRHDRAWFLKDKRHYVFTFHDSTLECVAIEKDNSLPSVHICETKEEADRLFH
ncbi:MAG TPA: hypothetical protein DER40_00570 [Geobacter sp.]|nr:hypothetical protein [Geobacter sp.]